MRTRKEVMINSAIEIIKLRLLLSVEITFPEGANPPITPVPELVGFMVLLGVVDVPAVSGGGKVPVLLPAPEPLTGVAPPPAPIPAALLLPVLVPAAVLYCFRIPN